MHYSVSTIILLSWFLTNNTHLTQYGTVNLQYIYPIVNVEYKFYLFISCYEITYYVLSLLYYFFIKNIKRKDDTIMFIHHIATIILIIICVDYFILQYLNDIIIFVICSNII